ncbi:MAG: spermidine/putrescine ABC transporter permease [Clostridiales bacterium 43-6]|nr:MAG: spermidine/putrescine ABC transporter permease [Clostridiales bacterium 43-6]
MKQRFKKSLPKLVTVSPVSIWLLILIAIPLVYVLVISFASRSPSGGIEFAFTLENYGKLASADYLKIYGQSILIAFFTTVISIFISYPFAYHMANSSKTKRTILMLLVIVPFWTNSLIRLYGWKTILGTEGVLNNLLMDAHIIKEPLNMLFTTPAVVLGMCYTLLPFMILPLYASIEKLDRALLEAASDLGAKRIHSFFHVTLPLTSPGIFAGSIMVFIPALGYFFVSDLLGGGNTMLIGNLIKNQFNTSQNWPLGAALSIVLIIVTLILVKIYTKVGGKIDDLGVA